MTSSKVDRKSALRRLQAWLEVRQVSLVWLLSLVILAGAVQAINMSGAPRRTALEGSNIAQVWSVANSGQAAEAPLFYSWPPLGWLQTAGWTSLSGAFERYDGAVIAGREAMVVAHVVAVLLLWLLARRLGFSRPAAAGSVAVYALSPLALQAHRSLEFANVATPWLLAAWFLALAPHRRTGAFIGSAGCFTIAVLTHPGSLFFLPFLGWTMWRVIERDGRRRTLTLAAVVLAAVAAGYILLLRTFGARWPGNPTPELGASLAAHLNRVEPWASAIVPYAHAGRAAAAAASLDPGWAVIASLGALISLFVHRLRPLAAAFIVWAILLVTPLGVAAGSVLAILAVAALLTVGAIERAWSQARRAEYPRWGIRSVAVAVVVGLAAASAVPLWGSGFAGLLREDQDRPLAEAQVWIENNVERDARLIVGPQLWVDLAEAGFPLEHVVSRGADVGFAEAPAADDDDWRNYDYVVSTGTGYEASASRVASRAVVNSEALARFGDGDQAVTVRRVLAQGVARNRASERADLADRRAAGKELVRNPSLSLSPPVRNLIATGQLDPRAMVLLPRAATSGTLQIDFLPEVAGEAGNARPRRQVLISGRDGAFLSLDEGERLAAIFTGQADRYRPASVTGGAGSLLVTWDLAYPTGIFG